MMFKKALTNSGRRLLKAIKKLSFTALAKNQQQKKQQHILQQQQQQQQPKLEKQKAQPQEQEANWCLETKLYDLDNISVISCSSPSFDVKSIDTFYTYVADNLYNEEQLQQQQQQQQCCCCCCCEWEENQRNENLENEMMR